MRRPTLANKLLLAAISLAIGLGAGELWLRTRSTVELGFDYRDGQFLRAVPFARDLTSNSFGFHDVEPSPKTPDVFRVLLVGDSYVASRSVSIPQSVGRRLEFHLNKNRDSAVDVTSVAMEGWGQGQELAAIKRLGARLAPDLVVTLFLSLNDVRNNYPPLQAKGTEQLRRMKHFRPGWWRLHKSDAPLFWLESSVLNRVLSHRLAVWLSGRSDREIPIDYFVYSEQVDPEWQRAWQETKRLLLETRQLARSLGAVYALVSASTPQGVLGPDQGVERLVESYPAMRELPWDLERADHELGRFSQEHGIPFLALEPAFRRLTREQGVELHWQLDGHWNIEGNDRAADLIAAFLRTEGLTLRPGTP
ncbi:MAG: hypothetical protein OES47_00040 [Acidobacteriota bacterium]|nr:hypothetical protein [Acidobacteriota bacterium]